MTEINEAQKIIDSLQDVFNLTSTENFEKVKKEAKGNVAEGYSSTAASSGYSSKAASSGNYSKAASSGYSSTAASSGDYSTASATGENVCAFACGRNVMAKASKGGGIALSEYDDKGKLLAVAASIVDGKKLLAGEWYKLEGGKFIHVDMSDNIFSRVKSIKKIGGAVVKTVIIDGEKKKSYVYISGGKSAHGVTVEKAKADLRYKIADRDASKFKAWNKTEKRPIDDLIEAYRVITGACESGTRAFVESQKITAKKMSVDEVITATKGAYGNEAFAKFWSAA